MDDSTNPVVNPSQDDGVAAPDPSMPMPSDPATSPVVPPVEEPAAAPVEAPVVAPEPYQPPAEPVTSMPPVAENMPPTDGGDAGSSVPPAPAA